MPRFEVDYLRLDMPEGCRRYKMRVLAKDRRDAHRVVREKLAEFYGTKELPRPPIRVLITHLLKGLIRD